MIGTGGPNGCYVWLDPEAADELVAALQEARQRKLPELTAREKAGDWSETMARAKAVAAKYAPKPPDLESLTRDQLVARVQEAGFGDLGFAWLRNVVEAGGGSFDKLKADHMINALRNPDQFR